MRKKLQRAVLLAGLGIVGLLLAVTLLKVYSPQASASQASPQAVAGVLRRTPRPTALVPTIVLPPIIELTTQPQAVPAEPEGTPGPARLAAALSGPLPAPGRAVNGLTIDRIVLISGEARQHIREIYTRGQAMGRNPHAFSKIGDSTMAYPPFLADFSYRSGYNLGQFSYLQPGIDYYLGSLARNSAAVHKGMHTWSEFDPGWNDPEQCQQNESPIGCEFRLNNPSVAIIRLGANDSGDPQEFDQSMRQLVDYCINNGVIPVLGTKPDRSEGPQNTVNKIIYQIAAEKHLPVWDYDRVASTVPDRGLESDGLHMKAAKTHDYTSDAAFGSGDPLEDLTGLMMLDTIRQILTSPAGGTGAAGRG